MWMIRPAGVDMTKGKERFIIVDLGVTFPNAETTPGVNLIMPDIAWIAERAGRIDGIFFTHAHEDHIGAIGHLYDRVAAPIYARPFTAANVERKLEECGRPLDNIHICEPFPATTKLGKFEVSFLPVSHSIPEASAMVISTPAGRIIHTGDFKLDKTPLIGEPFDPNLWKKAAGKNLHALVCDSTNVFSPLPGRSEASLGAEITALIKSAKGVAVATTFASNVARVKTLADAGVAAGRSVVLLRPRNAAYDRNINFNGCANRFPCCDQPR